jgi:preprotein translocase subunit SecA
VSIVSFPPSRPEHLAERPLEDETFLDRAMKGLARPLVQAFRAPGARLRGFAARVESLGLGMAQLGDGALRGRVGETRMLLHRHGLKPEPVARAFALVREISGRTLGMRHYATQIMGAKVMVEGMLAEMATGEGKTLAATLAAAAAALAGLPVHVVTVNDYLTSRDAAQMGLLYRALGLTTGCVVHGMQPGEKRQAYACDITYVTNKEVAFDYLRDRITLGQVRAPVRLQAERLSRADARSERLLMRGLYYAIVDEADSVLVDEARTPLIISGAGEGTEERRFLEEASTLATELSEGADYAIEHAERRIRLTPEGKRRIHELSQDLGPLWTGIVRREEIVTKALVARHLYRAGEHYLVSSGKVVIVDEYTGRAMPERSWEGGLHQLIELKEGCKLTGRTDTLARISYQRFFRRYLRLSGMTGTAWEVRRELWAVYSLPVVRIPTHRPVRREMLIPRLYASEQERWQDMALRVKELSGQGRPVLVGTRTVAASEEAARHLREAGVGHRVLNARQDDEEALIVAEAGRAGTVTVATNMAGRGTDIKLDAGVEEKGGLHVILTARHEAGRIDRQLLGRCSRQGDRGSFEAMLSLEDALLQGGRGGLWAVLARLLPSGTPLWSRCGLRALERAQARQEKIHARIRRELVNLDERGRDLLSFAGRSE